MSASSISRNQWARRANFSGAIDRAPMDRAIAEAEAARIARGEASRSFARERR